MERRLTALKLHLVNVTSLCYFPSFQMHVLSFHNQVLAVSIYYCIFYFDFHITVDACYRLHFLKSFMRRSDRCIDEIFKPTRLLFCLAILLQYLLSGVL